MTSTIFITLSIALLSGLLLSRVAKKVGLPAVTAYLVAGVIIGPYLLGQFGIGFDHEANSPEKYKILCDLALGFIAFAIGNEFRLEQLKKIGKQATIVGIGQALVTTVVVDAGLIALSFILPEGCLPLPAAIILGAVATATAPAPSVTSLCFSIRARIAADISSSVTVTISSTYLLQSSYVRVPGFLTATPSAIVATLESVSICESLTELRIEGAPDA